MRVRVVDESAERAQMLRTALLQAGYEVTASLTSALTLLKTIETLQPDIIVIDTDSPSRDVLEHLVVMSQHTPRPVVMFTNDGTPESIRAATLAGVSAYVVDGLDRTRITAIIDAAVARFEQMQSLRAQLAEANLKLTERKLIERAKGLLMKSRKLDEEAAYAALRKAAMDRNLKLSDVAQRIVDAADLLGAWGCAAHDAGASDFEKRFENQGHRAGIEVAKYVGRSATLRSITDKGVRTPLQGGCAQRLLFLGERF